MTNWLEILKTITNLQVLIQALGITEENQQNFWKQLLALLKSQKNPVTFEDELTGLIGQVIAMADFADRDEEPFISELYNTLKELVYNDTNDSFWNESVQQLIGYFINNFESQMDDKVLLSIDSQDEHSIRISDLAKADAGNSFNYVSDPDDYWVHPRYNIDNKEYKEVRGHDALKQDLNNDVAVQFTIDKSTEDWLRLLMPQYGRRVLVEDLNRNFWVIAQTIAAISAYLFDGDNPLNKMCEGLAREVSEIWENILYLWLEVAAISQKKPKDKQLLAIYVPPKSNEHDRHLDDFDNYETISWQPQGNRIIIDVPNWDFFKDEIVERLEYLVDDFSGCDLCILPIVRLDNYVGECYSTEWYPMILNYSYETKEWTYRKIKEKVGDELIDLVISPRFEVRENGDYRFTSRIIGVSRDGVHDVAPYVSPFIKTTTLPSPGGEGAPRMKFWSSIGTKVIMEEEEENLVLVIQVYDIISRYASNDNLIGKYTIIPEDSEDILFTYTSLTEPIEGSGRISSDSFDVFPYVGDVPSYFLRTASIVDSDNLFNNQAYVVKIGNYLPKNSDKTGFIRATVQDDTVYKYTSMYGNVTNNYDRSTSDVMYFRFRWDSYDPSKDGTPDQTTGRYNTDICYSKAPEKRPSDYPTQAHLHYDGLIAAKNFIKANLDTAAKNPCFIATTVGLTPWDASGVVYWDVAFVPAMYFYIPTAETLTGLAEDAPGYDFTPYIKAYTENEAIYLTHDQLNADEAPDGDGTIYIEEGGKKKEIGKIIACLPIIRYEAYFRKFGMELPGGRYNGDNTYIRNSHWRQFFITNDEDINSCTKEEVNGGAGIEGGTTIFHADFTPMFQGYLEYFDVVAHNQTNSNPQSSKNLWEDQIAKVSEAYITIDENGYEQTEAGSIRTAQSLTSTPENQMAMNSQTWEDRDSSEYYTHSNEYSTGFQQVMIEEDGEWVEKPDDIYQLIKECVGQRAQVFHGNTMLGADYCKYVQN